MNAEEAVAARGVRLLLTADSARPIAKAIGTAGPDASSIPILFAGKPTWKLFDLCKRLPGSLSGVVHAARGADVTVFRRSWNAHSPTLWHIGAREARLCMVVEAQMQCRSGDYTLPANARRGSQTLSKFVSLQYRLRTTCGQRAIGAPSRVHHVRLSRMRAAGASGMMLSSSMLHLKALVARTPTSMHPHLPADFEVTTSLRRFKEECDCPHVLQCGAVKAACLRRECLAAHGGAGQTCRMAKGALPSGTSASLPAAP